MPTKMLVWIAAAALGAVAAAYGVACVGNEDKVDPCPKYCSDIDGVCSGADQQYPDASTCLRFCNAMDPGEAAIGGSDTTACRALAVSAGKDEPDPTAKHLDCVAGGMAGFGTGGQACAASACAGFCKLDLALCGPTRTDYTDVTDCINACAGWDQSMDAPISGATGNSLRCRMFHLTLSQSGDPTDLETHCPHTNKVSTRCFDPDAGADAGAGDAAAD
jgi:hypothetical protein